MIRAVVVIVCILFTPLLAKAKCASMLYGGTSIVVGIPTHLLTSKLTFPYVKTVVTEERTASLFEQGVICSLRDNLDIAVTFARGIEVTARWDVMFTGSNDLVPGVVIPPRDLISVFGNVKMSQEKVALLWHNPVGEVTPFVIFGLHHVALHYKIWIPFDSYSFAEDGKRSGILPYLGAGFSFQKDAPYSFRIKYELYALKPRISMVAIGVERKF